VPIRNPVSRYVRAALAELPPEFAERIENVEFVVARRATPRLLRHAGVRGGGTLYGLYEGVPLTRRGSGYTMVPPDKITIFWEPLMRDFAGEALAEQVRKTVFHEIAHYFGISDEDLHDTSVG
jgi:predicted Zn-dependent protease with MMP-like domain